MLVVRGYTGERGRGLLVTGTAPRSFGSPAQSSGSEAIGEVVVDGPGTVVSARVGRATIAARGNTRVGNALKVGVTGKDGSVDRRLTWPGT